MGPRPTAWGAYAQIAAALRERIESGELPPGRFPSEATLCAEFHVARNTLRRALKQLEDEGLVATAPGVGRVVRGKGERGRARNESRLPQYRRIASEFRAAIERGELAPGTPLPPESELSSRYGVSRGTVRQALADLSGSGLVEPVHGKGWFVRSR